MYKPTSYLNLEIDPAHANPEEIAMLHRVFGFIDPLTSEPAEELSLTLRLKCRNRPYWDARDEAHQDMWESTVAPYLSSKLSVILNVLEECNNEKYAHYAGGLHLDWLRLRMEPCEINIRLDHNAAGESFLPDAYSLVCSLREAIGSPEFDAFATGSNQIAAYIPCRKAIETTKAHRLGEGEAWERWQTARQEDESLPQPQLAPALRYDTIELVNHSGQSMLIGIASNAQANADR